MTTTIEYDFSTTFNTLFGIIIKTPFGYVFHNHVCRKDEISLDASFANTKTNNLDISELRDAIHNCLNGELQKQSLFPRYDNLNDLKNCLQWLKHQLTTETLTSFISDENYIHTVIYVFTANDFITVDLVQPRNKVIRTFIAIPPTSDSRTDIYTPLELEHGYNYGIEIILVTITKGSAAVKLYLK